jgi:hypothetical protein
LANVGVVPAGGVVVMIQLKNWFGAGVTLPGVKTVVEPPHAVAFDVIEATGFSRTGTTVEPYDCKQPPAGIGRVKVPFCTSAADTSTVTFDDVDGFDVIVGIRYAELIVSVLLVPSPRTVTAGESDEPPLRTS